MRLEERPARRAPLPSVARRPPVLSHRWQTCHCGVAVEQVRLSKLVATQDDVGLKEVERFVEGGCSRRRRASSARPRAPWSALLASSSAARGKQCITAVRRQLFAQRLMGAKEAGARVIDADAVALGRWAEEHGHLEESDEHAEAPEAD